MSIYIRGMEMPENCSRCFCMASCKLWKNIMHPEFNRHRNCPLAPVPAHGRLIDAKYVRDKIIQKWMDKADDSHMYKCGMEDAYEVIRNAPTIIPAEEDAGIQKEFMQNWHEDGE